MKQSAALKTLFSGVLLAGLSLSPAIAEQAKKKMMMDHSKMDHSKMMDMKGMGGMSGMNGATNGKVGQLAISGSWARQSFGRAVNSAGFMVIKNSSAEEDMLVGASAPISARVELHTHIHEGNVMKMRKVEGGIKVPANGQVELKPGSFHVMFIKLNKALKPGDTFPLTLRFKKAGDVKIMVPTQKGPKIMPMKKGMTMDHSKMDHRKMDHGMMGKKK